MLKKVIAGWNAAPGAPANWNPATDGDCGVLPIRMIARADGTVHCCESAWEPTPAELEMLNAGGQVVLRVMGWQVPAALYVEPASKENATGTPTDAADEAHKRYLAACHAMQSGVATEIGLDRSTDTTPRHLRVGINTAMSDTGALARLLVAKGIFTLEEFMNAIADAMESEARSYEAKLGVKLS